MRSGSARGQSRNRSPEPLLNSEMASPPSSPVGRLAAAATMILEGSINRRFKGGIGLGGVARGSIFVGMSDVRVDASAISLSTRSRWEDLLTFELITGSEEFVAVSSAESGSTYL